MDNNINTRAYWENRFASGDWEEKQGRWQTESFAKGQMEHLCIPHDFSGTLLDFGCGLGDAFPIYKQNFPQAQLVGVDISQSAIDQCRKKFGAIASFIQGDHQDVPHADIIIASNVFEHLTDDQNIARVLREKCDALYIIVPYKEWPLCPEHINTYDENSFSLLGSYECTVFPCVGWTPYGFKALYHDVYIKNIFRFLLGKRICRRSMQMMFRFTAK